MLATNMPGPINSPGIIYLTKPRGGRRHSILTITACLPSLHHQTHITFHLHCLRELSAGVTRPGLAIPLHAWIFGSVLIRHLLASSAHTSMSHAVIAMYARVPDIMDSSIASCTAVLPVFTCQAFHQILHVLILRSPSLVPVNSTKSL